MYESSAIELSLAALKNNLTFLRRMVGSKVKISSVVKGNAYGHGIAEFVSMAYQCGIRHFSVFGSEEACEVKEALGNKATIMIMGMAEGKSLEWAIAYDVEFFVFEQDRLLDAIRVSKKLGKPAKVHIELETGLNRTGFSAKELPSIFPLLKKESAHLVFKGLCTHFAGAESISNYIRIQKQIAAYEHMYQLFLQQGLTPGLRHTACSAAAVAYPETRMDMVRIGIMQYGLWPSPETFIHYLNRKKVRKDPLKRVISWKSCVMATKQIKPGDFVGYGTGFMAHQKMKIAVVPVGYAHGYSRSLSNRGRVLIRGQSCMVVGIVNMNMIIVDVSEVTHVQKGDEVVLIGNQGNVAVTIASFSEFSNQLNYELLSRLKRNIPRKIVT